jgi:hypothetical protein
MMNRYLKSWHLFAVCVGAGVISTLGLTAQENRWPVVRPLRETRTFADPGRDNADTPFLALIKNAAGVPLYKFECHNGNYDDSSEMNFSGDFQCALFALKRDALASGNLLAANIRNEESTDWWNRGRMRSAQLREPCLAFPEYSTDRRFKLRGMLITMRFSGIEWSNQRDRQNIRMLGKFTFTFSVTPDSEARSPRAELPVGPAPPRSCYP